MEKGGIKLMEPLQVVVFSLDGQEYALNINFVKEIIMMTEITTVPNSEECVKGIINLRGMVTPIISLSKKFRLEESAYTNESRIMILSIGESNAGIIVDSVTEVKMIQQDTIQTDVVLDNKSESFIAGIANLEDRIIVILEAQKMIEINRISKYQDFVKDEEITKGEIVNAK